MSTTLWPQVQAPQAGSLEDLLLRIQRQADAPRPSRVDRLGRFLRALGHPSARTPALGEVLPHLMPKVRPRSAYAAYARESGRPAPEWRPLAGNLAVSLVADLPNQDLDLDAAQLQAWNADFDLLLQRARTNLLDRGGERGFQEVRAGCLRSTWRNGLDGSLVLLPGVMGRLPVQGDPVAVLPDRDALLVTGAEDAQGLAWILEAALGHLDQDPEALGALPLRLRDGCWEPLRLAENPPAAALLARLERRCQGDPRPAPGVLAA